MVPGEKVGGWVEHSSARHLASGAAITEATYWQRLLVNLETPDGSSSVVNAFSKMYGSALPIDPATVKLARKVAEVTGKALPTVVREAIEAQAQAAGISLDAGERSASSDLLARMLAITEGFAELPVLDPRPADEILGYDEHGVPQ